MESNWLSIAAASGQRAKNASRLAELIIFQKVQWTDNSRGWYVPRLPEFIGTFPLTGV